MDGEIIFRDLKTIKELKGLESLIRKYSLNYPNYQDWATKAISEIESGTKKTILGIHEGIIVGNIIYQQHKKIDHLLEIKNLRIRPEMRRRGIGYFLLKQVQRELENYKGIIIDMHSEQKDIQQLCLIQGYKEASRKALYDSNQEEILMIKTNDKSFLTTI